MAPADFGGKGSQHTLHADKRCPRCKQQGAYYLGSDVLHGNPYSPAADTEVEHHYKCANEHCKHQWSE